MLQFEWNKQKSLLNYRKHGISFESAISVFEDPHMLSWLDGRYEYGEERWIGLGMINNEIIIVLVHTVRENYYDEKEIIRIISARKANKEEQAQYFCYQPKKS